VRPYTSAWHARRVAIVVGPLPHPLPLPASPVCSGRRYERAWDMIEVAYARTTGTALWWEEGLAELAKRRRLVEMAAREAEDLRRARGDHPGAEAVDRASRYLAQAEGGVSGDGRNPQAWRVVLVIVRGFALSEEEAVALLASEYAPRCQPRLGARELRGMVRRATRASRPPWGALLNDGRRT
jgi:hypothetical protein